MFNPLITRHDTREPWQISVALRRPFELDFPAFGLGFVLIFRV